MIDEKVLIERLEKGSDYEPVDYDCGDMACSGEQYFIATDKAIEIVNQLAEESKQKNANLIIEFLEFVADNAFQYDTDNGWTWSDLLDLATKFCSEEGYKSNTWQIIYDKVVALEHKYAESGQVEDVNECIKLENLLNYFKEELDSAEKSARVHVVDDLAVIESLPSIYPLQPFEEEAIHRVVGNANNNGWIPCSERLPKSGVTVIVSYKDRFLGDGTCEGWYDAPNEMWHLTDYKYSDNAEVTYWRERLAPYQPKGE